MSYAYTAAPEVPFNLRNEYISMVAPHFKDSDFAITLTFRDTYKIDPVLRSKDVKQFLKRANTGLLGTQHRKFGRHLNCAYVFELNAYKTAIHLHMALENPDMSRLPENERLSFLRASWMKMDCSGYYAANDFGSIYGKPGWIDYVFKGVNRHTELRADVTGWTLNK